MHLLRFLFVGFIAGWVIGKIVRGRGFGFVGNVLIGGLGSIIGGYLYGLLGVPAANTAGALVMAIVGSLALFLLLSLVKPAGRARRPKEAEK